MTTRNNIYEGRKKQEYYIIFAVSVIKITQQIMNKWKTNFCSKKIIFPNKNLYNKLL